MDIDVIQLVYNGTFYVGLATELYLAVGYRATESVSCRLTCNLMLGV